MEDWQGPESGPGDGPDPGFGPPRQGQHHDGQPHGDRGSSGAGGVPRDWQLAGFAHDGGQETRPPSAKLVGVLESLSGAGWRCPDATDDEMVGMVRGWAAVESWATAAKFGVIRELIRREDRPRRPADREVDVPDPWSESLTHELAQALAASAGSADRTEWLAWELGTRLPGIGALLANGVLNCGKARAVAEAFRHLTDDNAAHAEALILGRVTGKTHMQVQRLAAMASCKVDPAGAERRRHEAEKQSSRVRLWREQSGAVALAGFDLPTDEALAAHANVSARADRYKDSRAFPGAKMDQLRAMAYLDLLNAIPAETRIGNARTTPAGPPSHAAADPDGPADAPEAPAGGSDDNHETDGGGDSGDGRDTGDDGDGGGPGGGGPGGDGPGGDGPDRGKPAGPSPQAATRPGTDLFIPLATLLGFGYRPGEAYRLGTLDPALCRDLALTAARSPYTEFCVTVTDPHGIAIGHGCARTRPSRHSRPFGSFLDIAAKALTSLPARVNLTISRTDLQSLAGFAVRGSSWALTPHDDDHGPPGGYGTWTLTIPGGREFTVRLERVPVFDCDHARESHAYQPSDALRHLVQVRDGECTFPPCSRHARECDFEHAIPYHRGGRTCACNAGARSRKCHRIKQSAGWSVTQPRPGFHQWTTPTGRSYTQEPKRYPD